VLGPYQADMLLEGEYLNLIERILDAMKVTRRDLIKQGAIKVLATYLPFYLSLYAPLYLLCNKSMAPFIYDFWTPILI
jgi:hypothetical protein